MFWTLCIKCGNSKRPINEPGARPCNGFFLPASVAGHLCRSSCSCPSFVLSLSLLPRPMCAVCFAPSSSAAFNLLPHFPALPSRAWDGWICCETTRNAQNALLPPLPQKEITCFRCQGRREEKHSTYFSNPCFLSGNTRLPEET